MKSGTLLDTASHFQGRSGQTEPQCGIFGQRYPQNKMWGWVQKINKNKDLGDHRFSRLLSVLKKPQF